MLKIVSIDQNSPFTLVQHGKTLTFFSSAKYRYNGRVVLGIDEDGATIVGTENSTGIELVTGSSSWISNVNISGVDRGLSVYGGSMVYLQSYQISAVSQGISVGNSHVLNSGDGSASIEGTNDRAVSVSHGVFPNWEGILEIKNLKGGRGINLWMSQGNIRNLKMLDFNNLGSGGNSAIRVDANSSFVLEGAEISGSTDRALIQFSNHSGGGISDSTITATSAGEVVSIETGSAVEVEEDSIITATSVGVGISVGGNSLLKFRNSRNLQLSLFLPY